MRFLTVSLLLASAAGAVAQNPAFEVASIKPNACLSARALFISQRAG